MFGCFRRKLNKNFKRNFEEKLDITKEEFEKFEKQGAIIVDVRSRQEYDEGHLNGAICIPEFELRKRPESYLKDKDEIIILYCSTGNRSKRAQERLIKMGYNKVYNLYNGM